MMEQHDLLKQQMAAGFRRDATVPEDAFAWPWPNKSPSGKGHLGQKSGGKSVAKATVKAATRPAASRRASRGRGSKKAAWNPWM